MIRLIRGVTGTSRSGLIRIDESVERSSGMAYMAKYRRLKKVQSKFLDRQTAILNEVKRLHK